MCFAAGATSAPCLIFIFPAVFYIRIVPEEEEPMRSLPKILVSAYGRVGSGFYSCNALTRFPEN